jgi:hypothetical protein
MTDFVDELLARCAVSHREGSSRSTVEALEAHFGATFPEPLLRMWSVGENIQLEIINAHIPGPTEILEMIDDGPGEWLTEHGYVPVLNDHESNYLMTAVKPPLAYRVIHMPHDDDRRFLYRDLNGFANALITALDTSDDANLFFRQTQGDYPADSPRPGADQDAARALMATDGTDFQWNLAVQLLDSSNLMEWAKLLETDHFVRRDVRARMRKMQSPAIRQLLKQDQLSFDAFVRAAAEAAHAAGLAVGEQRDRDDVLKIGGAWMNLDGFFHRRNIPNAVPRMIAWFEDLIAGRNPNDRAGNFMVD